MKKSHRRKTIVSSTLIIVAFLAIIFSILVNTFFTSTLAFWHYRTHPRQIVVEQTRIPLPEGWFVENAENGIFFLLKAPELPVPLYEPSLIALRFPQTVEGAPPSVAVAGFRAAIRHEANGKKDSLKELLDAPSCQTLDDGAIVCAGILKGRPFVVHAPARSKQELRPFLEAIGAKL